MSSQVDRHLGEGWADGAGGELAFVCPAGESGEGALTRPLFNRLTLFAVQPSGMTGQTHAVLPVVRADASRYAVSGWFTEREQSRATDRVAVGSNVHMVSETGRTSEV